MSKRLNPFEKELLIKLFRKSKDISKREFCRANNVTIQTFNKWIEQYDSAGIEGLAAGSKLPKILPEGINPKPFQILLAMLEVETFQPAAYKES